MAAKVLQISTDNITYVNVPGSGGEWSVEGEAINDTILGATFDSALTGLLQWSIKTDGIFKGFAGYLAKIKKGGTPVATTAEGMTLVSGKIFKITNAAKNLWSRTASYTIKDNAVNRNAELLWVDFLHGRVEFKGSYTVAGPVTADITYIPTSTLGKASSYSLTMTADPVDKTDFATAQGNSGHRVFQPGLRSVSLELGGFYDATVDLRATLIARTEVIIEIDPVGDGSSIARGYFRLMSDNASGDVGALESETATFALNVPDTALLYLPFSWQHSSTTLNVAIQNAIKSWQDELSTYYVRYLPQGAIGQVPNDGIRGQFVATNVSLSGGLSNMNVFTLELMGVGAYTVV